MKRLTISIISLLSLILLFSCTTERKSAGSVSLKFSENASSKISLLSASRAAESSLDYFDVVLTVSGDYESSKSIKITDEKELNGLEISIEEIDVGSNISVTLEIINGEKIYYRGSTSLVVVEGNNPVKIKLVKLVEDSAEEEVIEDITEVDTPVEELPAEEEKKEQPAEETAPAESEKENTEESKEETPVIPPASNPDSGNGGSESSDKPNIEAGGNSDFEISANIKESCYILYDNKTNKTEFRNILTGTPISYPAWDSFCFGYNTGNIIGVINNQIQKYVKGEDGSYNTPVNFSYNLSNTTAKIIDTCFVDDVVYILYVIEQSTGNTYNFEAFYVTPGEQSLLSIPVNLEVEPNSAINDYYDNVANYGIKTDGRNIYLLNKADEDSFISVYSVVTTKESYKENEYNPEQLRVSVQLNLVSNNMIINYDGNNDYYIMGNEDYKCSDSAIVSDIMIIGSKAYVLMNDRNLIKDNFVCRGALIELNIKENGVFDTTNEVIYGWNEESKITDATTQFYGPTKFNRISSTAISFVDEGLSITDDGTPLNLCRVVTINLNNLKQDGNIYLYLSPSEMTDYNTSFGYYYDTTQEQNPILFSNLTLN